MQMQRICLRLEADPEQKRKKKKEKKKKTPNYYWYAKSKKLTHFSYRIEKLRIHLRKIT